MADAEGIMHRARRRRGHLAAIADGTSEQIELHFLLGRPQDGSPMDDYEIAKTILEHAPFATEVVDENDIDDFVASIELPSGTAWCLIWLADIRPIISPTS